MRYHANKRHFKKLPEWKREISCARELCGLVFVPSRRWQIYHDGRCRILDRTEKQDLKVHRALEKCEGLITAARGENRSTKIYRDLCDLRRILGDYLANAQTTMERLQESDQKKVIGEK
jgi:hypothetical protein